MREDLLEPGGNEPGLAGVDDDLAHLFSSWFNRGFLVLRRVDWSTPADILERIIRYEAVHAIRDWDDLRRRAAAAGPALLRVLPPSLVDEPLIFVEVALTREIRASIQALLAEDREVLPPGAGHHGRVLLDQQLPAGPEGRVVRQLPDQAGGARTSPATCPRLKPS